MQVSLKSNLSLGVVHSEAVKVVTRLKFDYGFIKYRENKLLEDS